MDRYLGLTTLGAIIAMWLTPAKSKLVAEELFSLTVAHLNDLHCQFDPFSLNVEKCEPNSGECFGGIPRLVTKLKELRQQEKNLVILNAGDTFQGTTWYTRYKAEIVVNFTADLDYDAMTLGNHEFDDGVPELMKFLKAKKSYPIVCCNIDMSKEPDMQPHVSKSIVIERANKKIGIIGYLTKDTAFISSPGPNLMFLDEVESVRAEAKRLRSEGISIIIALGHAGFEKDKEIAEQVEEVDLVVGGHTNTFLYTGTPPSNNVPEDVYPTMVTQKGGKKVPVVQAYAYAKYVGVLKMEFSGGKLVSAQGNPVLVESSIEENKEYKRRIEEKRQELDEWASEGVAISTMVLKGAKCRKGECSGGNIIADSMVLQSILREQPGVRKDGWAKFPIAMLNSGSIRSVIRSDANGRITMGDIHNMYPYENKLVYVEMEGKLLFKILEHSVARLTNGKAFLERRFVQVSGLKIVYNLNLEPGKRVVMVKGRCGACPEPKYTSIYPDDKHYYVLMNSQMADGGDGFNMIAEEEIKRERIDVNVIDLFQNQMASMNPVFVESENRLVFSSANIPASVAGLLVSLSAILLVIR